MSTLWLDGDLESEARRNREAISARFSLPTYDVQQGGAITLSASRVVGTALPAVITSLYAVPTGVAVTWIDSITLVNMHTASLAVTLYVLNSGASGVSARYQIYADTLLPNSPVELVGPWFIYEDGWIGGLTTSSNKVAFTADLMEFTEQPAGLRLIEVPGVAMTTDEVMHYEVPGTCEHALLLATTLCNTDTSSRTATVYRAQVVSPVSTPEVIWAESMAPKQSTLFPAKPKVLIPGDLLVGKASAGAVVSVRHTILEVV